MTTFDADVFDGQTEIRGWFPGRSNQTNHGFCREVGDGRLQSGATRKTSSLAWITAQAPRGGLSTFIGTAALPVF